MTGGSGVVGSALVRHLLAEGHEVRGLARSDESARAVGGAGAQVVRGDVVDGASVRGLVRGCDWVFHVAGVNELCSRDPSRMWRVNVDGTRIVRDACAESGVGRLVHTSSAATIGEARGTVASESTLHRGFFVSAYERSKWEAERIALSPSRGLEVVSVNPSSVQGPGRHTGTGALLLAAARGVLPLAVDATFSIVDIDDCARGHVLAARRGRAGRRYLLSGTVSTTREVVARLSRMAGRARRPWYVRPAVVAAIAPFVDGVLGLVGRQSPLCAESARVVLGGHRYDGSLARDELGLVYTPFEETLAKTFDWFDQVGLL